MAFELLLAVMFATPIFAAPAAPAPPSAPSVAYSTTVLAEPEQRLFARCSRKQFDMDQLLSDATLRADLQTIPSEEARDIRDYAVCRALQGAPTACSQIANLGSGFAGFGPLCLTRATDYKFLFLALRGGDALSVCRSQFESSGKRDPSVASECASVIEALRAKNSEESCAALRRGKLMGADKQCEDIVIYWPNSPQDCSRAKEEGSRRDCLDKAPLLAGLRDPAKCDASPFCHALVTKSPAACDSLRVRSSRALCARINKEAAAVTRSLAQEKARQHLAEAQVKDAAAKEAKAQAEAEARAKKDAAAAAAKPKRQFKTGQPMKVPPTVGEIQKALEAGRPIPPNKEADPDER